MLEWNGNKILQRMHEAEETGLVHTGQTAVEKAKQLVRVDSSRLRDSIKVQGENGNQVSQNDYGRSVLVGVDEDDEGQPVEYAAIQELGPDTDREYTFTPYLKPAVDQASKKLATNIAKAFKK